MNLFWPTGNKDTTELDRRFILKRLGSIRANRILDTGAGHCHLTTKMAKSVGATETHAIDIDTYGDVYKQYNIRFTKGDLNPPLQYPPNYFDLVTSIHTIEHLVDTDRHLDEIFRVLKPGGYLLIETVNLAALHYRIMLLLGIMPNCLAPSKYHVKPFRGDHGPYPHKSVFTYRALLEIAKKHGFELVKGASHTIYPLPTFLAKMICFAWPNIGLYTSLLLRKPQ